MQIRKVITGLVLLAGIQNLTGQNVEWEFFGGGYAGGGVQMSAALIKTSDGGFLTAGSIGTSLFVGDLYIEKLDSAGSSVWARTHYDGNPGLDKATSLVELLDGNYALTGYTNTDSSSISLDLLIAKIDASNGDTLWTKTYGGPHNDNGNSIIALPDSGLAILGNYRHTPNNSDFYVLRTDKNGDTLWTRTFGGGAHDFGRSLVQTSDGKLMVCGTTRNYGPYTTGLYSNIWMLKMNLDGDTLWTSVLGTGLEDTGEDIAETSDGGFVISGRTGDYINQEADLYVVKTDSGGVLQWSKTYFGPLGNDVGNEIFEDTDGGYAVCGYQLALGGVIGDRNTVYMMKTDASGNLVWDKLIETQGGSPNGGEAFGVVRDGCGYVITGMQDIGNGSIDFRSYVAKVTEEPQLTYQDNVFETVYGDSTWMYQWLDCNNSNQPISGATQMTYTPQDTGSFALMVTYDNCSYTSDCFPVTDLTDTTSGITERTNNEFIVFPNPARGQLNVQCVSKAVGSKIQGAVYSNQGKLISEFEWTGSTYQIDISQFSKGMYYARFTTIRGDSFQNFFIVN